ncbi:hypothetical protein NE237_033015 [Protea cynaroides]|uniref:non-specific serine/threonine protein kinase n=1 Tax=Protea cynaroides TaxID=273540 RepID=A0A9Q0L433_9MAGN|nr:hypothetical protein NE237_033015 [Protea cynaroides]
MGAEDYRHEQEQETPSLDLKTLKVISVLGREAKGVVFLALIKKKCKDNGDKNIGSPYRRIWFARDVLKSFRDPLLPRLRGVVETDKIIDLAIDYCPGRDLNCLRKNQTEKMFSDDIIRFYAAELVLALEYLHGLGIVYKDLKPENVMIQETVN